MAPPNVLLIGPSHGSSVAAGLEAEQKILTAHGCNSWTAVTELTVKTSESEFENIPTPLSFLQKQIDACFKAHPISLIKATGTSSVELFQVLRNTLEVHKGVELILDVREPLRPEAIAYLKEELLPQTRLFYSSSETANLLLEDQKPLILAPENIIVVVDKHAPPAKYVRPIEVEFPKAQLLESIPFIPEVNDLVPAAITANKAKGMSVNDAITAGFQFAAASRPNINHGHTNLLHSTYKLQFAPDNFVAYLLQRPDVQEAWKRHTEHEFLSRLADGTLPLEAFKYYLIQDYLFLIQFARANSLAAYKEKDLEKIVRSSEIVLHINREMALHLGYCQEFGLSKEDILKVPESQACTAYTRYVLDIGSSEDWFALQVALSPCLIGYGVIARRLFDDPRTVREGNRYWKWIQNYVADDYTEAVSLGRALLEKHAQKQSSSRVEELVAIFIHATNMETGFWDMGYEKV